MTRSGGLAPATSHRTRKFLTTPDRYVEDFLTGFSAAHHDLVRYYPDRRIIVRAHAPVPGKVGLISAGGSGCEPLHCGFVGPGMLDVACPGEIFTSPVPGQIMAALRAADSGRGIVQVVKNYPGEVMNFKLVAMDSADEGLQVESIVVADDVAIAERTRRRALGATVLVEKLAGAAAERGADVGAVAEIGRRVALRARSFGIGLSSSTVPATGRAIFELPEGEIELGVGISGEPGTRRGRMRPAPELAGLMLDAVLEDLRPDAGARRVLLLVNGLGGTPISELYLLHGELDRQLRAAGLEPVRHLVGNFITALDQAGASITVLTLDDELIALWDAPVQTAALRWGAPVEPADSARRSASAARPSPRPSHSVPASSATPASEPGDESGLNGEFFRRWLAGSADAIDAEASRLCDLDAALGDGDHGTNMRRGFAAVAQALTSADAPPSPGGLLMLAGQTLLNTIGGASGALWGLALRRAGRTLGDALIIAPLRLADGVDAMVDAVIELGAAAPGDKTMLDALAPASASLRAGLVDGASLAEAARSAAEAARAGADATADMLARKGRASFLAERSLGHQDPSANTAAIVFECLHRAVAGA